MKHENIEKNVGLMIVLILVAFKLKVVIFTSVKVVMCVTLR